MPEVSAEDRLACMEASSSDSEPGPGDAGAAGAQSQPGLVKDDCIERSAYQRAEVAALVWILMVADEELRRRSVLGERVCLATVEEGPAANLHQS